MAELQGRNIEGVLFDADGTLIDTYDIILRSMDHVLNEVHGFGLTDAELMAGVGTPLRDQMRGFARGDEALAAELSEAYRQHNDAIHDEGISAFPDTRAALERLAAAGFCMGVVTSKRHEMAALGLELSGISSFFDVLIGYDDFPECKPLPGPVLHGCERGACSRARRWQPRARRSNAPRSPSWPTCWGRDRADGQPRVVSDASIFRS